MFSNSRVAASLLNGVAEGFRTALMAVLKANASDIRSSRTLSAEATSRNHSQSALHNEIDSQTHAFHSEIDMRISTELSPEIKHEDTRARLLAGVHTPDPLKDGGKIAITRILESEGKELSDGV